ncbi:unnamed protein product [Caenorhabditis nigoni]
MITDTVLAVVVPMGAARTKTPLSRGRLNDNPSLPRQTGDVLQKTSNNIIIRSREVRKFKLFPREKSTCVANMKRANSSSSQEDYKKIRSSQETSDDSAHDNEKTTLVSNNNQKNPSTSTNALESPTQSSSTPSSSLPVAPHSEIPQDNMPSPGYDYEPVGVDRTNLPAPLQLDNGEQYTVRGVFGKGGFGVVLRVRDRNGNQYAAKVLAQIDRRYSIQYELEAFKRITRNPHINLLSLVMVGKLLNPPPGYTDEVLLTEACGPSIRDIMMKARRDIGNTVSPAFSMDDIKRIGRQIGEGMLHLEKLKVYHLDLKATNVVFTYNVKYEVDPNLNPPIITMTDRRIKIIDYGNSSFHLKPEIPKRFVLVQPQSSRAPEIFMGIPYTEKADVWSMGCLMGELYTGRALFLFKTGNTQIDQVQSQFELILARINASVPKEMIEESKKGGRCTLNFNFLGNREEINNQDSLMSLMREETDSPLFDLLKFMLVFDPPKRPPFGEVLNHKFFEGI